MTIRTAVFLRWLFLAYAVGAILGGGTMALLFRSGL